VILLLEALKTLEAEPQRRREQGEIFVKANISPIDLIAIPGYLTNISVV
jgi:hypothetical protein